ncbi:HEAT repeat domain-containing protein [Geomonas anaerohicana]|uniref:HEAT repeat domain-containing protein n=1 Tax=Geomonas anaerohicana TaxID=2798583 RepID=A0ABS0Y8J8_9BACT|nr:HEAT repeat domain-containing protein [Geomonas anaerohicana]MBJ6748626.1 HEAT repeat domain-containing protein [Geomonas anaerohicana]
MQQSEKVDNSLNERRDILDLLVRLKGDGISIHEMEQIGLKFQKAGKRALRPLVRELWRENSGELITKYAYILDFFDTSDWLDQLIQIAIKRQDLAADGKAALMIALEGYGVDVNAPPFRQDKASSGGTSLGQQVQGAMRLGEEGMVTFLDDFLSYPAEVQQIVIRELCHSGDNQSPRLLQAMLWHEDRDIVHSALAALGKIRDPRAAAVLQDFLADCGAELAPYADKALRRLRFLGVAVPPPRKLLPFHAGYATPPDGDGYRSLLLSRWASPDTVSVLYMQVHERRGVLAAWGAGDLTLDNFAAEIEGFRMQDDLIEVAPAYLLDLVRDALYWSRDLCYLPADFYMRRGIFAGEDMTPARYTDKLTDLPRSRRLSFHEGEQLAQRLFADSFFSGWFMAAQRVYDFAEEYRSGKGSEQVLERFCTELLAPEMELIRERLLVSADLMRRCGRDNLEVARIVGLADSLVDNPLPLHLHPFLRRFALESMEIARESLERGDEPPLRAVEEL